MAIDNFTILIFIIITVIYRWVNNRLIYKFLKNDAETKEKMFATDSVLKRNQNAQYCKYAVRSKITSLFIERFLAPHEKTMVNLK